MVALVAFPSGAGARSSLFGWKSVHLHLNAYADWGSCWKSDGSSPVDWDAYHGICSGRRGAELGELSGVSFLNHSSKCFWEWKGNHLTVTGVDTNGHPWGIEGIKSDNFHSYHVTKLKLHSTEYVSGDFTGVRGLPNGPLAVHLSSHTYFQGITATHGYSLNLQGYVKVK